LLVSSPCWGRRERLGNETLEPASFRTIVPTDVRCGSHAHSFPSDNAFGVKFYKPSFLSNGNWAVIPKSFSIYGPNTYFDEDWSLALNTWNLQASSGRSNQGGEVTFFPCSLCSPNTVPENAQLWSGQLLTMGGGGGGVSPGTGYYPWNVNIYAWGSCDQDPAPYRGTTFQSWTGMGNGSYTGNSRSASVVMHGPITETANFINVLCPQRPPP
jgi:hypothetical protein